MGLADQTVMREQAVEALFAAGEMTALEAIASRLTREAREALAAQGAQPGRIEVRHMLHLRYAGTDTALIVPYGAPEQVVPVFTEAHRARFGFATPERPLIVEAVAVEATSAGDPVRETRVSRRDGSGPDPVDQVVMWTAGAEHVAPVFDRIDLRPGDRIAGPALIREANATTVVEPGWRAELTDLDHMLLRRSEPRATSERGIFPIYKKENGGFGGFAGLSAGRRRTGSRLRRSTITCSTISRTCTSCTSGPMTTRRSSLRG
jgi:5-oxoprolinase (ATP-hydrolysing)